MGSRFQPSRSDPGALRRLLLSTAFVAGAVAAVVNTLWMLYEQDGGRLRSVGMVRVLRTAGNLLGVDPARWMPDFFVRYYDLADWAGLCTFLGGAIAANVAACFIVTLALYPLLVRVLRSPSWRAVRWQIGLPLLLGLALLVPAVTVPAFWLTKQVLQLDYWGRWGIALTGVGLGSAWLLLFALLRTQEALWLFIHRLRSVCFGVAGMTLLGTGLGAFSSGSKPPVPDGGPNILLISIDSLRRDHVGSYGYQRPTTPHLDKLAREGVRFDAAVSPTSWTLPSHVTLLTALPIRVHQVHVSSQRFTKQVLTLTEVLSQEGYATAGIVGGSYLDAGYGFAQGFDHYDDYTVLNRDRTKPDGNATSPISLRLANEWLDSWAASERPRPFFLFLHTWDVHFPYAPPPPYDTMFDPHYEGDIVASPYMRNRGINPWMDPRDLEHVIALYDGEIRYTDDHLGRLFDSLRRLGVFDDTIIVVTSDHGDEFFEHGKKGHGQNLFDDVLRVPLVMRYPSKIPAGRVVKGQVRLMDVAPTILGLAGIEPPADFGYARDDGPHPYHDLTPLLEGEPEREPPPLVAFGDLHGSLVSLRTSDAKIIRSLEAPEQVQRYDLLRDPAEKENLFGDGNATVDTLLAAELAEWLGVEQQEKLTGPMDLDPEQVRILRSLGYLQ